MAKLVFSLQQSIDGYVDHQNFEPDDRLYRHFIDHVQSLAALVYGRHTYEIMRYWDEDQPGWDKDEIDFAAAWRARPKYVLSHTLKSVGPNATLVTEDTAAFLQDLKTRLDGEISIAGPNLVHSLAGTNLIDEYRLYIRPFVLGSGTPLFPGPRPPFRLIAADRLTEDTVRLTYRPAKPT